VRSVRSVSQCSGEDRARESCASAVGWPAPRARPPRGRRRRSARRRGAQPATVTVAAQLSDLHRGERAWRWTSRRGLARSARAANAG